MPGSGSRPHMAALPAVRKRDCAVEPTLTRATTAQLPSPVALASSPGLRRFAMRSEARGRLTTMAKPPIPVVMDHLRLDALIVPLEDGRRAVVPDPRRYKVVDE